MLTAEFMFILSHTSKRVPQFLQSQQRQQFAQKGASAESVSALAMPGMVITSHRSVSPAGVGAAAPARVEAFTQAEPQMQPSKPQAAVSTLCLSDASSNSPVSFSACVAKWRSYMEK